MKISLFTIILFIILIPCSCSKNKENGVADESALLFKKTEQLIRLYIDSINSAPDSISFAELVGNLDNKLTSLNYKFPPDTDLLLSEEENDSLITLFKSLEEAKKKRLNGVHNDSTLIPVNDSISQ